MSLHPPEQQAAVRRRHNVATTSKTTAGKAHAQVYEHVNKC